MSESTTATALGRLPAAGIYDIDRAHSSVAFSVRHLMVSKVRGRFATFDGVVELAEPPEDSRVEARIVAASIDTDDDGRDTHLRSPDFLDVERFPELTFRSTGVSVAGETATVDGELTIRGVTRPVVLDVELLGTVTDPWGGERVGFSASAEIDREDFDLTYNQALEGGGVLVGKRVRIELEVEAVRRPV